MICCCARKLENCGSGDATVFRLFFTLAFNGDSCGSDVFDSDISGFMMCCCPTEA